MALLIENDLIPPRWSERKGFLPTIPAKLYDGRECIRVAFINNMPDPALEDTEMQFFELLEVAAGDLPVLVKLYSLPGIPRGERGRWHLCRFYADFDDLWNSRVDAVIITGTEPHQPDLQDEPYWPVLTQVLEWAERHTISTVLSCLAAHASVLHSDGIKRHRLNDKQFGVFNFKKIREHAMTNGTADVVRFPHSRWNEVQADELTECGYRVLAKSDQAGVDSFVKRKKNSLFVHFQGHPEYGPQTLLKEYRRDIKRFIRHERETYPTMPHGYFSAQAAELLADFQRRVLSDPREELMETFLEADVIGGLQNSWHTSATRVYANWLQHVASSKARHSSLVSISEPLAQMRGRQSAVS